VAKDEDNKLHVSTWVSTVFLTNKAKKVSPKEPEK